MSHWTVEQDTFLLRFGGAVGYDHIAQHDFGKKSGRYRFHHLVKTGKAFYIARAELAKAELKYAYAKGEDNLTNCVEEIKFWMDLKWELEESK